MTENRLIPISFGVTKTLSRYCRGIGREKERERRREGEREGEREREWERGREREGEIRGSWVMGQTRILLFLVFVSKNLPAYND